MNKKIHILILVVFGFFLMPNTIFACGNHSEKKICKKEVSSSQKSNDCCCANCNSKDENHKGCTNKCGHSNCNIPSIQVAFFVPYATEMNLNSITFYTKKENFFNLKTTVSSGFQSLWLIPKIG
jgi:hypothetical protein